MFGKIFGQRSAPQTPKTGGTPPARTALFGPRAGALKTVIVRKSAFEAARSGSDNHGLVEEVVNFVNAMTIDGLYRRDEVVPKSVQVYHADFYLAQVNNGGHSQFVYNCFDNLNTCIDDACQGLAAMGADAQLATLRDLRSWIERNPEAVKQQTGFNGGRAAELDPLDKRFFAAEKTSPMDGFSARWILTWPELRPVEDADYRQAIHRAAMTNPMRERRLIAKSVASLDRHMTSRFQVATGLACVNLKPRAIPVAQGPKFSLDIDGRSQLGFVIDTNWGDRRFCVVTDQDTNLYEYFQAGDPATPQTSEGKGGPAVGARLVHIQAETIAGIIKVAKDFDAAAGLDLLMRRVKLDPAQAFVAPVQLESHWSGPLGHWLVTDGSRLFQAAIGTQGGLLLEMPKDVLVAKAQRREIQDHARSARDALAR